MSAALPAESPSWARYLFLGTVAGLLVLVVACGSAATPVPTIVPTDTPVPATPVPAPIVRVDGIEIPVDLAVTPAERSQGLSGRSSMSAGTGMLFVFEEADRFTFWMKEMNFPLDMVWIGAKCQVVDVSENVPHPDPSTPLSDLPRYSPSVPAMYVLEINGGESAAFGLRPGDSVEFAGVLSGEYGC